MVTNLDRQLEGCRQAAERLAEELVDLRVAGDCGDATVSVTVNGYGTVIDVRISTADGVRGDRLGRQIVQAVHAARAAAAPVVRERLRQATP